MKNILKFIFIGAVIATIVFGKQFIDKKTFKYEETVDNAITKYFISGLSSDLAPLSELLDKYNDDEEIVYNIQSYSNDAIWSWFAYVDGKYTCDKANLNSCKVQLAEFRELNNRLVTLFNTKSKNNYTLMLQSSYNNIINEVNKKTAAIEKIIASPSAKNPQDSEQIRTKKCSLVQDCTNCRDGVCTCTYSGDGRTEEIRCNREE